MALGKYKNSVTEFMNYADQMQSALQGTETSGRSSFDLPEDHGLEEARRETLEEENLKIAQERAKQEDKKSYKFRHMIYDFAKSILMKFGGKKITADKQRRSAGKLKLGERQEVFLGGTKPMTQYIGTDGSRWLAKKAVNCVGLYKIEGAMLTEAGARLQTLVDPKSAVEAYRGSTVEDGDVSFQRRLGNEYKGVDLFTFSKHPELATKSDIKQVEGLGDQLLREHVTDWLLCNFDTKGENFFVEQQDGKLLLHGIDKESAFTHLGNPDSEHMSKDFRPHKNNTLYNVVFSMYAKGQLNLNLGVMKDKVSEIVNMDRDQYMDMFSDYLKNIREKNPDKYAETYMKILNRKENLGKEYNQFFGELVKERQRNTPSLEPEEIKLSKFEEKGKDPVSARVQKVQDFITKLREDGLAKAGASRSGEAGISAFLMSQAMQKRLNDMVEKGNVTEQSLKAAFSADKFRKDFSSMTKTSLVKNIAKDIKKNKIDMSRMTTSKDFLKALRPRILDYNEKVRENQKATAAANKGKSADRSFVPM